MPNVKIDAPTKRAIAKYEKWEKEHSKTRQTFLQEIATRFADAVSVKLGDVVKVNGFTNTGKNIVVDELKWRSFHSGLQAKGRVINKDGTIGKRTGMRIYKYTE